MPGKGFEIMAFGDGGFLDRVMRLKGTVVSEVNGNGSRVQSCQKLMNFGENNIPVRGRAGQAVGSIRWA